MTCRELLELMHPNKIDSECFGGCEDCPSDYGFAIKPDFCSVADTTEKFDEMCRRCWDREVTGYTFIDKLCDIGNPNIIIASDLEHALKSNNYPKEKDIKSKIKDSGSRREFETGAVRDIQEGKGRCDLMPLDVIAEFLRKPERSEDICLIFAYLNHFIETGDFQPLYSVIAVFGAGAYDYLPTMFLEVAKHFEEGAKKYGEYNWQKGIPTHCYIDSAVRHYLKYLRGDKDEPHDRAFVWNILCCIWTCIHKPELNNYGKKTEKNKDD